MNENNINLSISKLSVTNEKTKQYYLGPWCDPIGFFKDQSDFLNDTHIPNNQREIKVQEGNKIYDLVLDELIISLNQYHSKNYSKAFWELLLSNWLTFIIDTMDFYYNYLCNANSMGINLCTYIDDFFCYNKLSDVYRFNYTSEYIHSLISHLIKYGGFKNINYIEKKTIKERRIIPIKQNPIKRFIFDLLNRGNTTKLSYGFGGMSKMKMLQFYFKYTDYSQSFKNNNRSYTFSAEEKNKFKFNIDTEDELILLLCKFIEKNLPTTVLDNLNTLIANSTDYLNKKTIIASPGLYHDEQLIELALAKEINNAVIIQIQEAGNGMDKYCSSAKYFYKPIDYYLTWGWKAHAGYSEKLIVTPSKLSDKLNIHQEKYGTVLYFTKFPSMYGFAYDSVMKTNWKQYINNRISFISTINNTFLKNMLIFKMHHSITKGYDESKMMKIYNCNYNQYNNKDLQVNNTAILYVDYLSAAIYQAMAYNTPIIMCIDYDIQIPTDDFKKMINKFKKVGIAFETPELAAKQIKSIYKTRNHFWNSKDVQDVRKEFLEAYVHTSNDWIGDTLKIIEKVSNIK